MSGARELAEAFERLAGALQRRREADAVDGMIPTQRFALALLVAEGPLRSGVLAERMGTTDATASRTVDALVELGLARRQPDPGDRRGVLVHATTDGAQAIERRRGEVAALLDDALAGMPAHDAERLVALVDELAALLAGADAARR